MRITSNSALSILFVAFTCVSATAGPTPPQPSVPPPPGLPVDGGLFSLVLIGVVYGVYKVYQFKINNKKESI